MTNNLGRIIDEMPKDVPEAVVELIDALREYTRTMMATKDEWDRTPQQELAFGDHMKTVRDLLTELLEWQVDINLSGVIKRVG